MILAIESSCDESALAIFDPSFGICGEWVHTQIKLHATYGGVVPDLASREHLRNLPAMLQEVRNELHFSQVKQIAVTRGPGLAACLALGMASAKALALELGVPLMGVNHLRGHAWSPFIALHAEHPAGFDAKLDDLLPHLGLIVSGGNTLLFKIGKERRLQVMASTRDDAAGEALDKGAKLLGLGYPGGPLIELRAREGKPDAFDFPRALAVADGFSFSGVKTSLRYLVEKLGPEETTKRLADLCASYQEAVIDALVKKTKAALREEEFASVGLSGGVANNQRLRSLLGAAAEKMRKPFFAAQSKHTGDNAGMI
ncbi:MAG TPA: tRNA (adenosine(37)-N6)-threonylcarbamoyltransferase complex transferase subunit TsaD, partial [Opitutaceae bacterium]|nr:tRNA (adenosine(37)-N6)-threonylcarbamoyltransferase complex transferase subunit TsaD [Opitutaceae bacterium]